MTQPAILFREIHFQHLRVRDLRGEAEQGPNRLRKYQLRIEQQEKAVQAAQEKINQAKVAIRQKELSIKENNDKVEKHRKQVALVSTNKEYQALRHEIDNEIQATRVLEDQLLELMVNLDEVAKQLPQAERELLQARQEYQKAEAEFGGKVNELRQRLTEAEAALLAAEAALPVDLRPVYDRLLRAHRADALAPLEGRSCAACYTDLTPQGYNDLRSGRMVLCKNCGKLLYLAE
jgi:hypothetical protein